MPDARPAEELVATAVPADLLAAKREASERWLRVAHHVALPAGPTIRIAEAVAFAPQNVHAVGVGRKIVEGVVTDSLGIRFYVVQKLAETLLHPGDRIPKTVNGIPTDVIESPPAFVAQASPACSTQRQKKQRPAPAGISVAHHAVTAGTIACYCRSTRDDEQGLIFVLSNNHVLAQLDHGDIGDTVLQPGPADGGEAGDSFALLHRFVPIVLDGKTPNHVDAALARVLVAGSHDPSICSLGRIGGTTRATEQMRVRKHGRTTAPPKGRSPTSVTTRWSV
jgi:hypothetical protein